MCAVLCRFGGCGAISSGVNGVSLISFKIRMN
jgi:hypothetical protein